MSYVLAVLSHGDPGSPYAERTLQSFHRHVRPLPEFTVYRHDGPGSGTVGPHGGGSWYRGTPDRLGFCGATRALWQDAVGAANMCGADHVFWLEHDFVFHYDLDVAALERVLLDPKLAQCALMRQPVNAQEKRRGCVMDPKDEDIQTELLLGGPISGGLWLRHRRYFTTNPSLMRAEFMDAFTFGDLRRRAPHDIECEGKYGLELLDLGFEFAMWGNGDPWVEHIGERTGHGY